MQEIEETRRIAQRERGLILPLVEAVSHRRFVWDRAKLYPKQEPAIFERKRISVIEASTKSGKTDRLLHGRRRDIGAERIAQTRTSALA